jgi:hypothetical protein
MIERKRNSRVKTNDPLDAVSEPSIRRMVEDIRALRHTVSNASSGLSDDELLQDAFARMAESLPKYAMEV